MNNVKEKPDYMVKGFANLGKVLSKVGVPGLRKGQDQIIHTVLSGVDCLGILPTGHGKSLTYIVPTLCMEWKCVIFSPLIALMQDQLYSLQRKGLRAGQISSIQTPKENQMTVNDWAAGEIDFLLVAPERLNNNDFLEAMNQIRPDFIAVDEAHTLSQWSHNFRSSYCKIADFVELMDPKVLLSLTATCSKEIEEDIRSVLKIPEAKKVMYLPQRKNLKLSSKEWKSNYQFLQDVNAVDGKLIIYCSTVKMVDELYEELGSRIVGGACTYHGQMSSGAKSSNQELFLSGEVRVVIATNAFGMGIDCPDIRAVFYRTLPGTVPELIQGFGRAGRDGKDSDCVLYYDENTIRTQEFFLECGYPSKTDFVAFFNVIKDNLNEENLCELRINDICELAGVSPFKAAALMENFLGKKVLERVGKENSVQVKILKPAPNDRFQPYYEHIEMYGIPNDKGYYELDMLHFVEQLGKSEQTVKNNLRKLDKEQCISFVPPSRVRPINIIGSIDLIDFKYLRNKERVERNNLDAVKTFHFIEDDEKHNYLEEYMKNEMEGKI